MHEVLEVPFNDICKTRLWLSDSALKEVAHFRKKGDPNGQFWSKIKSCCIHGFAFYEGTIVKAEWDGVFRVGIKSSLFRLIGFYESSTKQDFIVISTLTKKGQKLGTVENACITRVAEVKRKNQWKKKKAENEHYPRLAE